LTTTFRLDLKEESTGLVSHLMIVALRFWLVTVMVCI